MFREQWQGNLKYVFKQKILLKNVTTQDMKFKIFAYLFFITSGVSVSKQTSEGDSF